MALGCSGHGLSEATSNDPPQDAGLVATDAASDGSYDADTATSLGDGSTDAADASGTADVSTSDGEKATSDAAWPNAGDAGSLWASPGLPAWDAATIMYVQSVRGRGLGLGNAGTVFAKMGDSITAWPPFLYDIGDGHCTLGTYGALEQTITFFSATRLFDGSNSFNRMSDGATAGWTAADALGPPDAVKQELSELHPAYAIVMFGTNDIESTPLATYQQNMNRIMNEADAAGTVVVLSTIPDRQDFTEAPQRVPVFNDAIRSIASTRHLPLVDLFAALAALPKEGLGPDSIHPSLEPTADGGTNPTDFTESGLRYGFDVRNLLTVQALDRLRQIP